MLSKPFSRQGCPLPGPAGSAWASLGIRRALSRFTYSVIPGHPYLEKSDAGNQIIQTAWSHVRLTRARRQGERSPPQETVPRASAVRLSAVRASAPVAVDGEGSPVVGIGEVGLGPQLELGAA